MGGGCDGWTDGNISVFRVHLLHCARGGGRPCARRNKGASLTATRRTPPRRARCICSTCLPFSSSRRGGEVRDRTLRGAGVSSGRFLLPPRRPPGTIVFVCLGSTLSLAGRSIAEGAFSRTRLDPCRAALRLAGICVLRSWRFKYAPRSIFIPPAKVTRALSVGVCRRRRLREGSGTHFSGGWTAGGTCWGSVLVLACFSLPERAQSVSL
mmetsp:Transcript_5256/g.15221  ORF Transcript_5256/g.15221 Transcript_5256/m.15221 type:complete len:210 (+) Transcript_5256:1055-1684(+)